ncbi:MAG: hypothetical protein HOA72_16325, partial [Desulfobacula sp.]|nr:hypothetical protein [Desulfobacula sp.]
MNIKEIKKGKLIKGDCLNKLKKIPSNCIDLMITDPPYGLSYYGLDWDKKVPNPEVWKECLRVLKPGGFAFVMSSARQDVLSRMILNLGDAGFNMKFTSLYASGISSSVSLQIHDEYTSFISSLYCFILNVSRAS